MEKGLKRLAALFAVAALAVPAVASAHDGSASGRGGGDQPAGLGAGEAPGHGGQLADGHRGPSGDAHGHAGQLGDGQSGPSGQAHLPGHSSHPVGYVFAGTVKSVTGNTVTVTVLHANHHGHQLVGTDIAFDLTGGSVVVRDVNGDGARTLADVAVGDRVQVLARLPRDLSTVAQPFAARVLIDRGQRHAHTPRPSTQTDS